MVLIPETFGLYLGDVYIKILFHKFRLYLSRSIWQLGLLRSWHFWSYPPQ